MSKWTAKNKTITNRSMNELKMLIRDNSRGAQRKEEGEGERMLVTAQQFPKQWDKNE
jgi:hypothetical protein